MLDPDVEKQFAKAQNDGEVQSLLLQWTDSPATSLFAGVNSKRERLQRLEEFYRGRKESALRDLRNEENLIVRDLPASGSVILTAPVASLQKVTRKGSLLDRSAEIQVLPNVRFQALAVDKAVKASVR